MLGGSLEGKYIYGQMAAMTHLNMLKAGMMQLRFWMTRVSSFGMLTVGSFIFPICCKMTSAAFQKEGTEQTGFLQTRVPAHVGTLVARPHMHAL